MAATVISEAEYLMLAFEGRGAGFVDGMLVEPAIRYLQHGDVLATVCALVHPWRTRHRLFGLSVVQI